MDWVVCPLRDRVIHPMWDWMVHFHQTFRLWIIAHVVCVVVLIGVWGFGFICFAFGHGVLAFGSSCYFTAFEAFGVWALLLITTGQMMVK